MLPTEPILDETVLARLRSLGGRVAHAGEDVVAELVSLFERDSRSQVERMRVHLDTQDMGGVGEAAHALKGACLAVGARRVANLCKSLEIASRSDASQTTAQLVDDVDAGLADTWIALRRLVVDGQRAET
jgi:HPt (histidine-containing phosphotransfer) domain-containing protein